MTLPTAGAISIAAIAAEIGIALPLELTDARVRTLTGIPAGPITMPADLYGKSWFAVDFTIGAELDTAAGSPASGNRRVHRTLTAVVAGGSGSLAYAWTSSAPISGFFGPTDGATADWSQTYNTNEEPFEPQHETASITLTVTDAVKGLTLSATHNVTLG